MEKKGTAVEIAIAILACECVASPDLTGLGGGFVAMIYNHAEDTIDTLIATESSHLSHLDNNAEDVKKAGVPGMLMGLRSLHQHYSSTMEWQNLLEGACELASEYAEDNQELMNKYPKYKHLILSKELNRTFETISIGGAKAFYEGELGNKFITDLNKLGNTMLQFDLEEYK